MFPLATYQKRINLALYDYRRALVIYSCGLQQNLQVYENHINRRQCLTEEILDVLSWECKEQFETQTPAK